MLRIGLDLMPEVELAGHPMAIQTKKKREEREKKEASTQNGFVRQISSLKKEANSSKNTENLSHSLSHTNTHTHTRTYTCTYTRTLSLALSHTQTQALSHALEVVDGRGHKKCSNLEKDH